MEEHSTEEPVHVAVQMATVGIPVEVSVLHVVQLVMHFVCSRCDLVVGGPAITVRVASMGLTVKVSLL